MNMNIQNETKTQSSRLLNRPGVLLFQEKKSAIVAAAVKLIYPARRWNCYIFLFEEVH